MNPKIVLTIILKKWFIKGSNYLNEFIKDKVDFFENLFFLQVNNI